jgi:endonuclease G
MSLINLVLEPFPALSGSFPPKNRRAGISDDETSIRAGTPASLPVVTAFGVGALCSLVWCRGYVVVSAIRTVRFSSRSHHLAGQCCSCDILLKRRGFAVGYNYFHKCPVWVSMVVCGQSTVPHGDRSATETFLKDAEVDSRHQANPGDFRDSGFDRGHMAPRATVAFSPASCAESFYMTNVVPQNAKLNRTAWRRLEEMVREWAAYQGRLAVVVGPVFPATPRRVGGASVPDAFYLGVQSLDKPSQSIAFLIPNAEPPHSSRQWIMSKSMSINELEKKTQLRLFRQLPLRPRPWPWHRWSVGSRFLNS